MDSAGAALNLSPRRNWFSISWVHFYVQYQVRTECNRKMLTTARDKRQANVFVFACCDIIASRLSLKVKTIY